MKLRNKKTGEIMYLLFNSVPVSGEIVLEYMDENAESGYSEYCRYRTLAELNEEWEDYAPLLKDDLKLKCFKLWCRANDLTDYTQKLFGYNLKEHRITFWNTCIEFDTIDGLEELEDGKYYSYSDLCAGEL